MLLGHVQGTIKAHCASEEPWGEPGFGDSCPRFAACSRIPSGPVAERGKCVLLIADSGDKCLKLKGKTQCGISRLFAGGNHLGAYWLMPGPSRAGESTAAKPMEPFPISCSAGSMAGMKHRCVNAS